MDDYKILEEEFTKLVEAADVTMTKADVIGLFGMARANASMRIANDLIKKSREMREKRG